MYIYKCKPARAATKPRRAGRSDEQGRRQDGGNASLHDVAAERAEWQLGEQRGSGGGLVSECRNAPPALARRSPARRGGVAALAGASIDYQTFRAIRRGVIRL